MQYLHLMYCLQRGRVQPRITGPAVNPADSQAAGQSQPSAAAYTADQRSHICCAIAYIASVHFIPASGIPASTNISTRMPCSQFLLADLCATPLVYKGSCALGIITYKSKQPADIISCIGCCFARNEALVANFQPLQRV